MQRLDNEDIPAPNALEWTYLVLTVLEFPFLVPAQRQVQRCGNARRKIRAAIEREQADVCDIHLITALQPVENPAAFFTAAA